MVEDFERCYRAVLARDARFDGWFVTAVTSTHIYCRPSCPARTPSRPNVRFYPSSAAAQRAGFRACKRCRPDASPGSPEWNVRQDVVARAMRMIGEGVVDRDGVAGLARSPRPTARANSTGSCSARWAPGRWRWHAPNEPRRRAVLVETTELPVSSVAFAAGFASVRQFNDTIRQVFACTPTELRRHRRRRPGPVPRHPEPAPGPSPPLRRHRHAGVPGPPGRPRGRGGHVRRTFARTLTLPARVRRGRARPRRGLRAGPAPPRRPRDLTPAVQRCRHLLDLDADPVAVADHLGADPVLGPTARRTPGLRVPGTVDPHELAVRAVVGQQVSVASARGVLGRLVAEHGVGADFSSPPRTGVRFRDPHAPIPRHRHDRRPRPRRASLSLAAGPGRW